ncbi:MAG: phosphate ABC transporter permease PstA [Lentisphaeria bacterium]
MSQKTTRKLTECRRPLIWRRLKDWLSRLASFVAIVIAISAMTWILWTVIQHGFKAISWNFLSNPSKPYGIPDAGIANALLGSLLITGGAVMLAVPPALAAGIYVAEFGASSRWARLLRFSANVMMGIPSIIVGLFVYVAVVVPTGSFSGFAGSAALAIIMFPLVMRTTEDMLSLVPAALRESALALGMSRSRTILSIVCRATRNGLVTGILLALARVSGETAPLLFTALYADAWPKQYFTQASANLPVLITEYSNNSPFAEMHRRGWGAALVVMFLILLINIGTRIVFREKNYGK